MVDEVTRRKLEVVAALTVREHARVVADVGPSLGFEDEAFERVSRWLGHGDPPLFGAGFDVAGELA